MGNATSHRVHQAMPPDDQPDKHPSERDAKYHATFPVPRAPPDRYAKGDGDLHFNGDSEGYAIHDTVRDTQSYGKSETVDHSTAQHADDNNADLVTPGKSDTSTQKTIDNTAT